jgi:hypothetical protein
MLGTTPFANFLAGLMREPAIDSSLKMRSESD